MGEGEGNRGDEKILGKYDTEKCRKADISGFCEKDGYDCGDKIFQEEGRT